VLNHPEPELDVRGAHFACVGARLLDHDRCHVDADDAPLGPHLARGEQAIEARATAEVEHGLASANRGDSLGVATTQP
jgi:hypothetical protein